MPGKTPPLRHDADGAAPPIPADAADPRSPRSPAGARVPTHDHAHVADARTDVQSRHLTDATDVRLEHDRPRADAVPRAPWVPTDVRSRADIPAHHPKPIPRSEHYADPADAKTRTTAKAAVT